MNQDAMGPPSSRVGDPVRSFVGRSALIALRVIGALLAITGSFGLIGAAMVGLRDLVSPIATPLRYLLMTIAGVGLLFARRWGVLAYISMIIFGAAAYWGAEAVEPRPVPMAVSWVFIASVLTLSIVSWKRLS